MGKGRGGEGKGRERMRQEGIAPLSEILNTPLHAAGLAWIPQRGPRQKYGFKPSPRLKRGSIKQFLLSNKSIMLIHYLSSWQASLSCMYDTG